MVKHFSSLKDPEIVQLLKSGAVGVIPTDTVYGLVAQATHQKAIERLYTLKHRDSPPGTMIGASAKDFSELGFSMEKLAHVQHYWPASLSVVVDATPLPPYLKQDRGALPLRVPDNAELQQLLQATGPLMTTSANAHGEPTSVTARMAQHYFGDAVDFYVDGGDLSGRPPSTIIGLGESDEIIVYRQGAVII